MKDIIAHLYNGGVIVDANGWTLVKGEYGYLERRSADGEPHSLVTHSEELLDILYHNEGSVA